MSSANKNLSDIKDTDYGDLSKVKIAIITSDWNEDITYSLRDACIKTLVEAGVPKDSIFLEQVPGAYELVYGTTLANAKHKPDAVIALGCVIKGETDHDKYINQAVASGLMQLNLMLKKPVVFGVLTPNTKQQALDRAGGSHGNKGVEAAHTALRMMRMTQESSTSNSKIGF